MRRRVPLEEDGKRTLIHQSSVVPVECDLLGEGRRFSGRASGTVPQAVRLAGRPDPADEGRAIPADSELAGGARATQHLQAGRGCPHR